MPDCWNRNAMRQRERNKKLHNTINTMKPTFFLCLSIVFLACTTHSGADGQKMAPNATTGATQPVVTNETVKINPGYFSRLRVSQRIKATYHVAAGDPVCHVRAPQSEIERLNIRVERGTLIVAYKKDILASRRDRPEVKVDIYGPVPSELTAQTSAHIEVADVLNITSSLTLNAVTQGTMKLSVDAPSIYAKASTSGRIELSGPRADWLKLEAATSGYIAATGLKSQTTELHAATSGHVYATDMNVTQTAFLNSVTSGHVEIAGKGHNTYVKARTSGTINMKKFVVDMIDASAATSAHISLKRPADYKGSSSTGGKIKVE